MNNTKGNMQKGSDPGKTVNRSDPRPAEDTNESQNIIPSDTILAEKDEVKNAEERLRVKKNNEGKGEN